MELTVLTVSLVLYAVLFLLVFYANPDLMQDQTGLRCSATYFAAGAAAVIVYKVVCNWAS